MSSRRHQEHGAGGVNLGLIITPMLDMSFQILAFFIMTYHPSALEGHLAGSLSAREMTAGSNPLAAPDDAGEMLERLKESLTVIITATSDGKPDKLLLRTKAEPAPQQIADGTRSWTQACEDLGRELKKRTSGSGAESAEIRIEADGELRQAFAVNVFDVCRQAGHGRISFVPPPRRPAQQ
jgi:biopolymer transport protein ExbD